MSQLSIDLVAGGALFVFFVVFEATTADARTLVQLKDSELEGLTIDADLASGSAGRKTTKAKITDVIRYTDDLDIELTAAGRIKVVNVFTSKKDGTFRVGDITTKTSKGFSFVEDDLTRLLQNLASKDAPAEAGTSAKTTKAKA